MTNDVHAQQTTQVCQGQQKIDCPVMVSRVHGSIARHTSYQKSVQLHASYLSALLSHGHKTRTFMACTSHKTLYRC